MAEKNDLDVRVRRKVAKQLYDALHSDPDQSPFSFYQQDDDRGYDDDPQAKRKGLKHAKPSPYTLQNFLWIIAAIGTSYYSEFFRVLATDVRIRPTFFFIGAVMIALNVSIAVFLVVYLSWVHKMDSEDWDRFYPAAIPLATACFAFGSLCLTVALWPVWSVLTIPILFVHFMGGVVIIAMFK